ncbi:MAG: DUF3467 domain-containing protein [candidate division Zixibacteria bacterium]|nr:DUF3467 domain-containing protein [candidate division Zixibacteria bacterium]
MQESKKGKQTKELTVTVVPYEKEPKERIYSNFVVIRHSPYDFSLEFCEIPPPTVEQDKKIKKTKKIRAYVKTKIVLPAKVIPSLIQALTDNYNKYEKKFEKK